MLTWKKFVERPLPHGRGSLSSSKPAAPTMSRARQQAVFGLFPHHDWRERLAFTDRTQMTLYLRGEADLPDWVAEEIESRYQKNQERRKRLREALSEVSSAFASE